MNSRKLAFVFMPVLAPLVLGSCLGGEQVGSASGVIRTSILPTSVPYYLDLCGQDPSAERYRLYSPSAFGRWAAGEPNGSQSDGKRQQDRAADRAKCTADRKINNGDPITVRLHRVGIGGLARFSDTGRCKSGCKRDVAIVLDFNGSQTLQKPIVAFYQRNVDPDGNLQFLNQTIFTQNEWFYRYPPSVRVRLYDVRDDKDRSLKANLETVSKGVSFVRSYIAGAAVAGPIVDTAIKAAEQLVDGPRNRPILDMSFQLFPQQQQGAPDEKKADDQDIGDVQRAQQAPVVSNVGALSKDEIVKLQRLLKVDTSGGGDGTLGPKTQAAIRSSRKQSERLDVNSSEYNLIVREIIASEASAVGTSYSKAPDPTFGSPIYASQFIVFNEMAPGLAKCDSDNEAKRKSGRSQLSNNLPPFYYLPDGVRAGGGRVYADFQVSGKASDLCLLETPFVIFSITRENGAVAADVAKRISDLQTKFAADSTVSEDAITSLGSAYVDAELALAIDRVENTWRADQLAALLRRIEAQKKNSQKFAEDDASSRPLASSAYRFRAYRLIEDYMNCPAKDDVREGYFSELADLLSELGRATRMEGKPPPYLKPIDGNKFTCPAIDEADLPPERSLILM